MINWAGSMASSSPEDVSKDANGLRRGKGYDGEDVHNVQRLYNFAVDIWPGPADGVFR